MSTTLQRMLLGTFGFTVGVFLTLLFAKMYLNKSFEKTTQLAQQAVAVQGGEDRMQDQQGDFFKKERPLTQQQQVKQIASQVSVLLKEGFFKQAEVLLNKTLAQFPKQHRLRVQLGDLYLQEGRLLDAKQVLSYGLTLHHTYPGYLEAMAMVHQKMQEPEKAISLLLKVPSQFRNRSRYMTLLASAYYQSGLYEVSKQHYMQLVQHDRKNSQGWLGLALSMEAMGDLSSAVDSYQQVKRCGGLDVNVLQYVGHRIAVLSSDLKKSKKR